MEGLSPELHKRCRETLLKCGEFNSDASLHAVFATIELHIFRDRLPAAPSKSERVDACMSFLLSKRLTDGRPALPLLLAGLCDRYQEGDALRDELEALVEAVKLALSLAEPSQTSIGDHSEQAGYRCDVFVSYNHADRAWAQEYLLPRLKGAELKVCDDRDFEVGISVGANIAHAAGNSVHTMIVLTPEWVQSEWSEFESLLMGTDSPAGQRFRFLPLMLRPCELPAPIAGLAYADLTDPARHDETIARILQRLSAEEAADAAVTVQPAHIFISYKRDADPDESVALEVFCALNQQYEVFIDQSILVGTRWAERIEDELRQTDFLIVFLSDQSVHSEMVLEEVTTAHYLTRLQGGHPVILPVRLAYREPFPYPLNTYLDPINWAFWRGSEDSPRLITELVQAISGGTALPIDKRFKPRLVQVSKPPLLPEPPASAQPADLEMPEGTMSPQSKFYIERSKDQEALKAIRGQGATITIKGPRQMGKSSLLLRIMEAAANMGKRVAFLDFQLFDKSALNDADVFFPQFCAWLTVELGMDDRAVDKYWSRIRLGNSQICSKYVGNHLLKELNNPLVLAMDEVERVFDTGFRSDFFSMLRSWHNSRSLDPIWKQLDLALVTSTEPYQLIADLNQSPFNVGVIIDLEDFTLEQLADLNRRHGSPLSPDQERQLMTLLGGHPYLVRRALYLVASQRISISDLFTHATDDRGPFGDHLRHHLLRLHRKEELTQAMLRVIRYGACQDEHIVFRLRGAGLVRREGHAVLPRCQLYAEYFREHLNG